MTCRKAEPEGGENVTSLLSWKSYCCSHLQVNRICKKKPPLDIDLKSGGYKKALESLLEYFCKDEWIKIPPTRARKHHNIWKAKKMKSYFV